MIPGEPEEALRPPAVVSVCPLEDIPACKHVIQGIMRLRFGPACAVPAVFGDLGDALPFPL